MSEKVSPMQEQLLSQASDILHAVTETVGKASNFAVEQLPDVAVQYVAYGRAIETTLVSLGLLLIVVSVVALYKVCIKNIFKWRDTEARGFTLAFGVIPLFVLGMIIFAHNVSSFFMVWLAPKVWLMRELISIIK